MYASPMEADEFDSLREFSWAVANIANILVCVVALSVVYQELYIPFAAGQEFSGDFQVMCLIFIVAAYTVLAEIILIVRNFEQSGSIVIIFLSISLHVFSIITQFTLYFLLQALKFLAGLMFVLFVLSIYLFILGGVVGLLWFGVKQIF